VRKKTTLASRDLLPDTYSHARTQVEVKLRVVAVHLEAYDIGVQHSEDFFEACEVG
jgi:hypothetical protein